MIALRRVIALTAFAAAALVAGCTMNKTSVPSLAGPSELALSLQISAIPDTLRQDGASQAQIVIQARDANAQPLRNVPLRLDIVASGAIFDFGQLSAKNIVTGNDGRTSALYTAPPAPAAPVDTFTIVTILVTPVGTDYNGATVRSVDIRLTPGGIILPPFTPPVPRFTFSPSSPSVFTDIRFDASASTGAIVTYAWDFGDGGTASGVQVTHQYRTSGSYNVKLTVTDAIGQTVSVSQFLSVSSVPAPAANFSFSPSNPNPNQNIFFNASSSTASPGRSIVRYEWDFGTGSTASGVTVTKSYDVPGTYTVTLTVSDDIGQTNTISRSVIVAIGGPGSPSANFTFSPTSPTAGQAVFFNASTTTSSSAITSYQWDFGDGTSGTGVTTSHPYRAAGTYEVILIVTDASGQRATITRGVAVSAPGAPTVSFTFSPTAPVVGQQVFFNGLSSSSPAGIVAFSWDFGDGSTGTGGQTNHAYASPGTFTVRLRVTDANGATAQDDDTITVTAAAGPTANITFSPTTPAAGQPVNFSGSGSTSAPGTTITSFAWNFGDGTSGTGVTTSHTFAAPGTYVVRLVVTDSNGRTGTTTQNVTATAVSAPTASFTFSPTSPAVGQTVNFNGSASTSAPGTTITTYAWDFGDGSTVSGASATTSHPYSAGGTYVVRLTVTDSAGRTGTSTQNVTVTSGSSTPPTASFTFSPSAPGVGDTVSFNASASTAGAGRTIASYSWTFGDDTSSGTLTSPTTSHVYTGKAFTYNVVLTVRDDIGQMASVTQSVPVGNPTGPTARFTLSPSPGRINQQVIADGSTSTTQTGQTIVNYQWSFGDSTASVSSGTNPLQSHTFTVLGTYSVTLTITDSAGRTSSSTTTILINP